MTASYRSNSLVSVDLLQIKIDLRAQSSALSSEQLAQSALGSAQTELKPSDSHGSAGRLVASSS